MTQALKKIGKAATNNERKTFYVLVTLIAFVSFFYGFFVQQTIMNVVEREKTLKEARVLSSEIGDLESAYIALKNNITLDFAYAQGFKDADTTEYISKRALGRNTISPSNAF
jgi:hypothetical protein